MTRKEAERIVGDSPVYVTYTNYPSDYKLIGSNAGIYGWNWNLFKSEKDDSYCISWFRNIPAFPGMNKAIRIF